MAATSKPESSKSKKPLPVVNKPNIPVIEVHNAYMHYGVYKKWNTVLENFSLSANSGEIYALLGPRGCGKTTVLHVIMGIHKLSHGSVTVFQHTPGHKLSGIPGIRVGYTPQNFGLYQELTVQEILCYYGALLNLDSKYVKERVGFLRALLNLPSKRRTIIKYTKGIKRQISFAIALLHEPEVLLLDEPCYGIDPLLRRNMWEYMYTLTKQNVTILVTTQNGEEARLANRIGFMKFGGISLEGDLKNLLNDYNEKQVDGLYRKVYTSNFTPLKPSADLQVISIAAKNTGSEGFLYTQDSTLQGFHPLRYVLTASHFSLKRLGACMWCDFIRAIRSYSWMVVFLILPVMFLIIFCLTIGTTPSSVRIAVVNYEASRENCVLNYESLLSCQVLKLLDNTILEQVPFSQETDAWIAANNLEISAIVVFGVNFTKYINTVLGSSVLGTVEPNLNSPPITLSLDLTTHVVANTIENTLEDAIENFTKLSAIGTEVEGTSLGYPMQMGSPIFGTEKNQDTQYMAPGLALALIYHFAALNSAITVVTERVYRITQRDYLAGVRLAESIISHTFVYGFFSALQSLLIFFVLFVAFPYPEHGSLPYMCLIVFIESWSGLSFGILIASISANSITAGLIVFSSGITTLILSGVQWPLSGLPYWLRTVIKYLPQTQSIEAVRLVLYKYGTISQKEVWLGIVIPFCWGLIFTLGYTCFYKIV